MADKIKPLKIEDAISGTEMDMFPTEADPNEDFVAVKGVAFENLDTTTIRGDSGVMKFQDADVTTEVTLEDLLDGGNGASPGFNYGRQGFVSVNTWLLNEGVPSNRTGRVINITDPVAQVVSVSNRNTATFTVTFFEHDGNLVNLSTLGSITVTSANSNTNNISVNLTQGKQLAARLTNIASGTVRDLVVQIIVKGTTS